jgi:hypothetical protein
MLDIFQCVEIFAKLGDIMPGMSASFPVVVATSSGSVFVVLGRIFGDSLSSWAGSITIVVGLIASLVLGIKEKYNTSMRRELKENADLARSERIEELRIAQLIADTAKLTAENAQLKAELATLKFEKLHDLGHDRQL